VAALRVSSEEPTFFRIKCVVFVPIRAIQFSVTLPSMKFRLDVLLSLLAASTAAAQQPQVPILSATSLQRGAVISRSVRALGYGEFTQSKDVSRIGAVKVVLRSFSAPRTPYEVQCFFSAKDRQKNRYIFDVKKTTSSATFDEIQIFARDLFGGSEIVDQRITTERAYQSTPYGGSYSANVPVRVFLTKVVEGSTFEGWIVRVISAGKVVRTEASLHELKQVAENHGAILDQLAADAKFIE
jgi:hypothetical protein